jgi:hypothetical protein
MLDLIKSAVGMVAKVAKAHPVVTGLGLAAVVLPKLFGASQPAMMGAQQSMMNQMPPGGMPPQSPGSF